MEALVQQHGLANSTQWNLPNQGHGSWAGLLAKIFGRPAQRNKSSTFAWTDLCNTSGHFNSIVAGKQR
eukprot:11692561-Prorocentrum_lima.AAC.1